MGRLISISDHEVETVLTVGVQQGRAPAWEIEDSLDELAQLCDTAGAEVVRAFVCRVAKPNPATFIGAGKAEEIAEAVREGGISTVVFDDDLSAAQGRNLEKIIGTKVIDRTQVILDIFAQHARSREGRMQIELAQLDYLLPRLRRMWTHLERQKGGIGMHGPGEKQLELDRRRILERIDRFRRELEGVRGHRAEQRRGRRRHGWALVSLVGYTNAGKSTLLNALTGADVLAYDQLFATLDPTTRQMKLPDHQHVLLTDTVGFIRKLPHGLVEAFKATLEEVVQADLLVHVIDASHPHVERQIEAVRVVLTELGVEDKPVVHAINKIDLSEGAARARQLETALPVSLSVSARTGAGLDHLREVICDCLKNRRVRMRLRIPLSEGKLLAALKSNAGVLAEAYEDNAALIEVAVPAALRSICAPYVIDPDPPGVE